MSRAESERIGERVARAHAQAKLTGKWHGPIPFGMQVGDQPGLPEPDVAQAALVEEVFVRVIRGDALTRIAIDFNERGLLPRRGQRWTHTGIARLIASPALAGMVDQGGEYVRGAFEGVVSEERWRAAQAALRRRPRGELRRPEPVDPRASSTVKSSVLPGTALDAERGRPGLCQPGVVVTEPMSQGRARGRVAPHGPHLCR